VALRKQYHFRTSQRGYCAWSVERLVALASTLPTQQIALSDIAEIDEPYWFDDSSGKATCRDIAEHARLIDEAELRFPIILSSDHRVMDGMHRVLKALNAGLSTVEAVIFEKDPEPDYVDVLPDDLPY
jgi:arginase family enzyme